MSNTSNTTEIETANTIEIFISSFGIILITKMAVNMDESNLAADGLNENWNLLVFLELMSVW